MFQDGCIVCPTTDSTFDLRTGTIKEWYPKNPVLRVLTPPLRSLFVYPVKIDGENIYIRTGGEAKSGGAAEIVFSGRAQPGFTATDVNVEEVSFPHSPSLQKKNKNFSLPSLPVQYFSNFLDFLSCSLFTLFFLHRNMEVSLKFLSSLSALVAVSFNYNFCPTSSLLLFVQHKP